MAEQSAKSFLSLVERSGIVAPQSLKSALSELAQSASGKTINATQLASHLVDSGLLTDWHCEKIAAGKYKGFFLGKFKLLGHLGTGGMSSVYLAKHKISGQLRAIKVLPRKKVADKSYLDRFYREGKAAASLNHPNVVRMYDICNEGNTHYMVMEYVEGADLYEIVKESGPLPIADAVEYMIASAEGLIHAHKRNLVHRDIKPANLLLSKDGVIKILDLGLALMRDQEESLTVLYNEKVMGTADYLSPEQAVNSHDVDHRADIYSLGCTLYYLVTGHPPFPDGTLAQRIARHQTKEPAEIRESREDCPQELAEICKVMMRKNADHRFQSCQELKDTLIEFSKTGKASLERYAAAASSSSAATIPVNDSAESFPNLELTSSSGTSIAPRMGDSSNTLDPADSSSIPIHDRSNAQVRTDDISAIQTTETPVMNPVSGNDPFSIDTSGRANPSANSIKRASGDEMSAVKRFGKNVEVKKRKQAIPTWVLSIMIGLMLIAMLIILLIVNTLLGDSTTQIQPEMDHSVSLVEPVESLTYPTWFRPQTTT